MLIIGQEPTSEESLEPREVTVIMKRFLTGMFLRALTVYERWLPKPVGGSRNAAIFGTALWLAMAVITSLTLLSIWLGNSLPTYLHPQHGSDWLFFALWLPVLFACDRYVAALVSQYDEHVTTGEIVRPEGRRVALSFLMQWASIIAMLIVIAEARGAR